MLDESTEFGAHAAKRLREEIIGWLTTVTPEGAPRPIPVWFLWDGDRSLLVYSRPKGEYKGDQANHVLIDFQLVNDTLADGKDHVGITVSGPGIDKDLTATLSDLNSESSGFNSEPLSETAPFEVS